MFGAKRLSLDRGLRKTVVAFDAQLRAAIGGADRDRTGGLLVANQALSQLSYSPDPAFSTWHSALIRVRTRKC